MACIYFVIIIFIYLCLVFFFSAIVLHDGPEETAIREVWEETGVRAGTCFEDN